MDRARSHEDEKEACSSHITTANCRQMGSNKTCNGKIQCDYQDNRLFYCHKMLRPCKYLGKSVIGGRVKLLCRRGVRVPGCLLTRGATRAGGTFNLVSCCKNFHHWQTSSLLTKMKEWTSQRKKVAVIFLLWHSKMGWMEAGGGQGCFAAVFVKHVLELQGAARWENGTLWKETGREESGGKGGRSLMRPRECL